MQGVNIWWSHKNDASLGEALHYLLHVHTDEHLPLWLSQASYLFLCAAILFLREGTEDALHLNIYSPSFAQKGVDTVSNIAHGEVGTLLPVMVFFHGGGFVSGSGSRLLYGPELLLDKEVLLKFLKQFCACMTDLRVATLVVNHLKKQILLTVSNLHHCHCFSSLYFQGCFGGSKLQSVSPGRLVHRGRGSWQSDAERPGERWIWEKWNGHAWSKMNMDGIYHSDSCPPLGVTEHPILWWWPQ